jgi:HD-GYP domain-containing protein (c-di-GMP phosphodiesterase class II)
MTSDRPYRPARPLTEARAEIARKVGLQFCPRVVAALDASFRRWPAFWSQLERRGQKGESGDSIAV